MKNLSKKSTAEHVYEAMRGLIISGELRAGQSLKAAALQQEFGFGLTPLREALSRLKTEHLVESVFNQGFRVAETTLEELEDLGQARLLLESVLLSESIETGGEEWESAIVAAHYQLGKLESLTHACQDEEIERWETRHEAFHSALLSACRSCWLQRLAETISAQRQRYHRNILRDVSEMACANPEIAEVVDVKLAEVMSFSAHTDLMEAVLERKTDFANNLLADHVQLTSEAYLSFQKLVVDKRAA